MPDYRSTFGNATSKLEGLGYVVENPAYTQGMPGWTWANWMRESIVQLMRCDAVALLPGWQYSRGACVEKALADELGMDVRLLDEWLLGVRFDVESAK